MQVSAELSLYPLSKQYRLAVQAFIEQLVDKGDISAVTNSMSTQIHGDIDAVFAAVRRALQLSYEQFGEQVLVAKFIPEHQRQIPPGQ